MKYRFLAGAVVLAMGATGAYAAVQNEQSSRQQPMEQRIQQRIDKRFDRLDLNHDGALTKDELTRAVEERLTRVRARVQKRIDARFTKADTNHDGVISRDEWAGQSARFDRLDANHDGVLSKDEVQAAVSRRLRRRLAMRVGVL